MPVAMTAQKAPTEHTTWDGGAHIFTLEEIVIREDENFEKTEKYPGATFVWVDAEGDRYYDNWVKVPKGFRLNDKAKWTNRLSALAGRPLGDDDAAKIIIDFGPDINSYDDLHDVVRDNRAQAVVQSITFNGVELIGQQAMLTLGVNEKGYNTCSASGASPVPRAGTAGKRRPGGEGAPI